MVIHNVFFGGTRRGIEAERDKVIVELNELRSNRHLNIIFFDDDKARPATLDAKAFRALIMGCDLVIFALGEHPGTMYKKDGKLKTYTLEEMEIAVSCGLQIYVLMSHKLDGAFMKGVTSSSEKAIWKQIDALRPTQMIIPFDPKTPGHLAKQVRSVLKDYEDEYIASQDEISRLTIGAWITASDIFISEEIVRERKDVDNQIKAEIGNDEYPQLRSIIALAYVVRRFVQDKPKLARHTEDWLRKFWLYAVSNLTDELKNQLANDPKRLDAEISEWMRKPQLDWFSALRQSKRALIIRWLLERGLVYRYTWKFNDEVKTLSFAKELGENVDWIVGRERERIASRFYEVYLAAISYAKRKDLINALKKEQGGDLSQFAQRLDLVGIGIESRKLQALSVCAAIVSRPTDGIQLLERARELYLEENTSNTKNTLKNLSNCYIMIGAMKADGKTDVEIQQIKADIEQEYQRLTGEQLVKVADVFFGEIWRRINTQYQNIWT